MQQFIKFGRTPKQEDLIMWILSRSELRWGNYMSITFGGDSKNNNFNGSGGDDIRKMNSNNERSNTIQSNGNVNFHNSYPRTAEAANDRSRENKSGALFASNGFNDIFSESIRDLSSSAYTGNPAVITEGDIHTGKS